MGFLVAEPLVSQILSFVLFHLLYNTLWDIGTDVLLEGQQLANSRRAQGLVLGLGTEIDGLKLWSQLVIEVVHVAFIDPRTKLVTPYRLATSTANSASEVMTLTLGK